MKADTDHTIGTRQCLGTMSRHDRRVCQSFHRLAVGVPDRGVDDHGLPHHLANRLCRLVFFPKPRVPLLFELVGEFLVSRLDNSALIEDVDIVRHNVIEQSLIVGHDDDCPIGAAKSVIKSMTLGGSRRRAFVTNVDPTDVFRV